MANTLKKELAPKGLEFKPAEFVISDKWCTILTVVSYPKWISPGFLANSKPGQFHLYAYSSI